MLFNKSTILPIFFILCISIYQLSLADLIVNRFNTNPLMDNDRLSPSCDDDNDINFPTIVRAPIWLQNRLYEIIGSKPTYLMYFSDHHGKQIFMAYSNNIKGPWNVYAPGTLKLSQVLEAFNTTTNSTKAEIASADIYIDDNAKLVRMYFHRRVPNDNFAILTSVAYSKDGIHFDDLDTRSFGMQYDHNNIGVREIDTRSIGTAYMRHFVHEDYIYLTDRQGKLWRSRDGVNDLEEGSLIIGNAFINQSAVNGDGYTGYVRHIGLIKRHNMLYIYGTRIGDAPERILWTKMCLSGNWTQWTAPPVQEGFRPVTDYEGANLPIIPSKKGNAPGLVNQLRDPFPFSDLGRCYIFYTIAGENGIAAVQLPYCW
nr:hypothetical protein [Megavirus caiporensis]